MHCSQLPNGWNVYYRSRAEFDILTREFVRDTIYDRHGIALEEGACILDVGANIGFFVLHLNTKLAAARVYSFEPIPDTFAVLEKNVAQNNKLDVRLFNFGLSDRPGEAEFTHFRDMSVASSMVAEDTPESRRNGRKFVLEEIRARGGILKFWATALPGWMWWPTCEIIRRWYDTRTKIRCPLRTLSDVIDQEDIRTIDLLKLDIEGAEAAALAGLREEHWPRIRQAVIETHHGPAEAEQMAASLRNRGFSVVVEPAVPGVDHLHLLFARRAP